MLTPERLQEIREDIATCWTRVARPSFNQFTAAREDTQDLLGHIDAAETNHKRIQAQALRDAACEMEAHDLDAAWKVVRCLRRMANKLEDQQ